MSADHAELLSILEKIEYRLLTSDGQMLAEAAHGETLTPENSFQLDLAKELEMVSRAMEIVKGM